MRTKTLPHFNGQYPHRYKDGKCVYCDKQQAKARLTVEHCVKADLLNAINDLITENDKYGGCPCSSPAWGTARAAIAKATTLP